MKSCENVGTDQIIQWLKRCAEVLNNEEEVLTQLDREIGDADHGINMNRGFRKIMSQIDRLSELKLPDVLRETGMLLISSVGGASGPLYGTFFLRAGSSVGDLVELDKEALLKMFVSGLEGIQQRGKAVPGDKTIVDSLSPAVDELRGSVERDTNLANAVAKGADAAQRGMLATVELIARKGRASYLGPRSVGHQDPGATSCWLIIRSLAEILE